MRSRSEIEQSFEAGEHHGVLEAIGPELTLEVLLDIRNLLLASENRTQAFTEELQRLRQ